MNKSKTPRGHSTVEASWRPCTPCVVLGTRTQHEWEVLHSPVQKAGSETGAAGDDQKISELSKNGRNKAKRVEAKDHDRRTLGTSSTRLYTDLQSCTNTERVICIMQISSQNLSHLRYCSLRD
jgi:hypothetical protein